jgi:hypothetical protein
MFPPFPVVASDGLFPYSYGNRATESPISYFGNWQAISGLGTMDFNASAGCAQPTQSATASGCAYIGGFLASGAAIKWPVWDADQFATLLFDTLNANSAYYLFARLTGNNYYQLVLNASNSHVLYRVVGGVPTSIGTFTTTLNSTDSWTLAAIGTTISVYQNTTLIKAVTDSTIVSGVPGMGGYGASASTDSQIGNFNAGSIASAPYLLVPSFTDSFQRANESPLSDGGKWLTVGSGDVLEILSDECTTTTSASANGAATYTGTLSNTQYGGCTVQTWQDNVVLYFYLRSGASLLPSYVVAISASGVNSIPYASFGVYSNNIDGSVFNCYLTSIMPIVVSEGDQFVAGIFGTGKNGFLYVLQNGNLIFVEPIGLNAAEGTAEQSESGTVGLQLYDTLESPAPGDVGVINFIAGVLSPTAPPPPPTIPLPFSKRTTAAVVTFACLQQSKFAQALLIPATAATVATVAALQAEHDNLYEAYRKLRRQDVANQALVLDDAIGAAQAAINALYATVQAMTLPVPPPDDAKTLVNIQAVVANAVQTMSNVVADE